MLFTTENIYGKMFVRIPDGFNPEDDGAYAISDFLPKSVVSLVHGYYQTNSDAPEKATSSITGSYYFSIMLIIDGNKISSNPILPPIYRVGLVFEANVNSPVNGSQRDHKFDFSPLSELVTGVSKCTDASAFAQVVSYELCSSSRQVAPAMRITVTSPNQGIRLVAAFEDDHLSEVKAAISQHSLYGKMASWNYKLDRTSNSFYAMGFYMAMHSLINVKADPNAKPTRATIQMASRSIVGDPYAIRGHQHMTGYAPTDDDDDDGDFGDKDLSAGLFSSFPVLPKKLRWGGEVAGIAFIKKMVKKQEVTGWADLLAEHIDEINDPMVADWLDVQASKMESVARISRVIAEAIRRKRPPA